MRQDRAGDIHAAKHIGAKLLLDLRGADVFKPTHLPIACVVHQHIYVTKMADGLVHGLIYLRLVGDV